MAIRIGEFVADHHAYHHPDLGTDLKVIQEQALNRAKGRAVYGEEGSSTVVHYHLANADCDPKIDHEVYQVVTPTQGL